MKMTFENLGPLARGELELANLTILCGQNNSGKTYVTYVLYCLLKSWVNLCKIDLNDELATLNLKGVAKIDIDQKIIRPWSEISKQALAGLAATLPEMMAMQTSAFVATRLNWDFAFGDKWRQNPFLYEHRNGESNLLLTIIKPANSSIAEITSTDLGKELISGYGINAFIGNALLKMVLNEAMPDIFIASSERTGATIFRQELVAVHSDISTFSKAVESITGNSSWVELANKLRQKYPRPVKDNARFAIRLPHVGSESGSLAKAHPELLDYFATIVGGQYVTDKNGTTDFQPSKTQVKLGLGETSSAVRSLLIVWYWLKYQAKEGSMLMIDEPELNLHPDNQRYLARFLARLVNLGVRVFITTHSDTIVREFNTLLMLSRNLPHFAQVRASHGYQPEEQLRPDQVLLYVTGEARAEGKGAKGKRTINTLIKVTPDPKLGLDVQTFDQTILDMNQMQDDLRYGGE
jgi:AAA ATPase domain